MVLGTQAVTFAQVPHELPGQDPEGGSEVDFAMSPTGGSETPVQGSSSRTSMSGGQDMDPVGGGGGRGGEQEGVGEG